MTASVKACWKELNEWKFAFNRLTILGVQPPDPSVQLTAIKKISDNLIKVDAEVTHKYYTFLVTQGISGSTVTQPQVDTLWRYLSAESREFADAEPTPKDEEKAKAKLLKTQQQEQQAAVAAALAAKAKGKGGKDDKGGKGKPDKGKDKGNIQICAFFNRPGGCKNGYPCPHYHVKPDGTRPVSYTHLTLPTKRIV